MLGQDTLPTLLRDAAERFGDHPAYVEGDSVLSYTDLLSRVEATASAYAEAGVGVGDRVVLWGPNSTTRSPTPTPAAAYAEAVASTRDNSCLLYTSDAADE